MKKLFLFLLISPLLCFAQNNGGIKFQNITMSQLLAKAKSEKKMIFIDAYTTWCGPCKLMASEVFPQKTVGDFYNANFINAKIDMEKGEGITIAEKYKVNAYPTYLFINADGKLLHKVIGYYEAPVFISAGKDALDPAKQFFTLKEKYNSGVRLPAMLYNLTKAAADLGDEDAGEITNAYFKTQKDWFTLENLELLLQVANSPMNEYFTFLAKNETKAAAILGTQKVDMALNNTVLSYAIAQLHEDEPINKQIAQVETIAKKYRPAKARDLSLAYGVYLAIELEEFEVYEKLSLEYVERNKNDLNALQLNEFAWNFFLHISNNPSLKKALGWALESVKKEELYYNIDTVANLYNKLGDKKNAKTYAEKAITVGKAEGIDVSETETLLKSLK
jgi:thioredoxin-related protein